MNVNNNGVSQNFFLKNNFKQNQETSQLNPKQNQETKKLDINDYLKDIDFISLAENDKNSRITYDSLPNGVSRFNYKNARFTVYKNNNEYKSEFYYPKGFSESEFFKSYSSLKPEEINLTTSESASINGINGEIDENVVQGNTGDCWIISALYSLTSTDTGKKAIKDSIKVNDDNTVTVTFYGLGVSYTMSAAEIEKYDTDNNTKDAYSNGDNDALVMEIATEKLVKDINKGKVKISTENENISETEKSISDGGFPSRMIYYLTGVESTEYYEDTKNIDSEKIIDILKEAYKNGNCSISFGLYNGTHTGTLINGSGYKVNAGSGHALSIKKMTEDTVTFINPWDGSCEYTMSYSEFANFGIGYLSVADLSELKYKENIVDMTGYTGNSEKTDETDKKADKTDDDKKVDNTDDADTKNDTNEESDDKYKYYDYEFDYDFNPRNYGNYNNRNSIYAFVNRIMSFLNTFLQMFLNQSSVNDYFYRKGVNSEKL